MPTAARSRIEAWLTQVATKVILICDSPQHSRHFNARQQFFWTSNAGSWLQPRIRAASTRQEALAEFAKALQKATKAISGSPTQCRLRLPKAIAAEAGSSTLEFPGTCPRWQEAAPGTPVRSTAASSDREPV